MRRFARHNRKDRPTFRGSRLTNGCSRSPSARICVVSRLINSHPTKLKVSPFMGYNEQFRKGEYLCSKAIAAGN
jgi:hypothetical protein